MQIRSVLVFFVLVITYVQAAEPMDAPVVSGQAQDYTVDELKVDQAYLDAWGITKDEYKRFIYIKRNTPRGVITPSANPVHYLGLEARTPEERRRYAEKMAQIEFEHFNKGRLFREETQLAAVRLYGQGDIVDMSQGEKLEKAMEQQSTQYGSKQSSSNNVKLNSFQIIHVQTSDCADCLASYKSGVNKLSKGRLSRLEIVFPAGTSDLQIRQWAKAAGVPIELNKRGVIELRLAEQDEKVTNYPTVVDGTF